uniref:Peptidase S1 domain-containing protein n=1 Tax=Pelodiscus sinensis TaxID=13735 RepID=K7F858_PELSI
RAPSFWVLGLVMGWGEETGTMSRANMAPLCAVFSRIIGGQDVQEGKWPWQVSVQEDDKHVCGGSLIAAQWVVSAAHCFNPSVSPSQYRVVLGAHQLANPSPHQVTREVQQIILQPSYNKTSFVADIALVRLGEAPAPPPPSAPREGRADWDPAGPSPGPVFEPLPTPKTLQQLEVPIISTAACNDRYNSLNPNSPLGPERIKSSMLCAGYTDSPKGFCNGDSGGPLACEEGDTWYLAGAVSWFRIRNVSGELCSEPEFPGVFTRVMAYDSWIQGYVMRPPPSSRSDPRRPAPPR